MFQSLPLIGKLLQGRIYFSLIFIFAEYGIMPVTEQGLNDCQMNQMMN